MKKIISILLICFLLLSQMIVVFAEISDVYESDTIEYVTLPNIPQLASFRHVSAVFFVSDGVDGNGVIRAADAHLALRFSAKIQKYTQAQLERSDVNCDGRVTASDARVILRCSGRGF